MFIDQALLGVPRVVLDFSHRYSCIRVEFSHLLKQVSEVCSEESLTVWFMLGMLVPKGGILLTGEGHVKRILRCSCVERRMLADHNKKNDSKSKNINLLSLVLSPKMDFWGHVPEGSECCFQKTRTISSLNRSS